jgi:hypothetical protein
MPFSHLQIDQPLPDEACWFRFVTNSAHVTSDRTLHYQALKGAQFSPSIGKLWQHELSGAVVGKPDSADQIRDQAEARINSIKQGFANRGQAVPSKVRFMGVACATASKLRAKIAGIDANTAYTPDPNNLAHTDVVTFSSTNDASIDPVRYWLMKKLKIILPAQIEQIIA